MTPADPRIRGYLDTIAARLPGPRRRRARILTELGDGLDEAVTDAIATGRPEPVAAAIGEFGPPDAVADAFAGELATARARQAVAWLLATGPLVGVWWLALLRPDRMGLTALIAAIPVLPLVAVGIAAAAGTFATTGRLIRWLPESGPRRALAAAATLAALAIAADLAMIALHVGSRRPTGALAVAAITASAVRVGAGVVVIRHLIVRYGRTPAG
jgi:hypothetical protein